MQKMYFLEMNQVSKKKTRKMGGRERERKEKSS